LPGREFTYKYITRKNSV